MTRRTLFALLVLASAMSLGSRSLLAQPSQPLTQLEQDYWHSTQQIGTIAAYQAYLEAFPSGFFSALAHAWLQKNASSAGTGTGSGAREAGADSAAVEVIADRIRATSSVAKTSGAISISLGDRLEGPGVTTMGWLGSKKQVVLPRGTWLLVYAADSFSSHSAQVQMTTLAFARIDKGRLASVLIANANSRASAAGNSWSDEDACRRAEGIASLAWSERSFLQRSCVAGANLAAADSSVLMRSTWPSINAKLEDARIDVQTTGAFSIDFVFTDSTNFQRIAYIDFQDILASTGDPKLAPSALRLDPAQRRREWAEAYLKHASLGFRRSLEFDDIEPGSTKRMERIRLPD